MVIDIESVRPQLLKPQTMSWLDELRAFRHVFLHDYLYDLDKNELQLVIDAAEKIELCYKDDVDRFLKKLERQ